VRAENFARAVHERILLWAECGQAGFAMFTHEYPSNSLSTCATLPGGVESAYPFVLWLLLPAKLPAHKFEGGACAN
jgi:hypothetical protein